MLTIHYSPNSHYPDNITNVYDLIREKGKEYFVLNFPTSGDIATNDYLPIAIAGNLIRKGTPCIQFRLIEYTLTKVNVIRFSDDGGIIEPLTDDDSYQFQQIFDEE